MLFLLPGASRHQSSGEPESTGIMPRKQASVTIRQREDKQTLSRRASGMITDCSALYRTFKPLEFFDGQIQIFLLATERRYKVRGFVHFKAPVGCTTLVALRGASIVFGDL